MKKTLLLLLSLAFAAPAFADTAVNAPRIAVQPGSFPDWTGWASFADRADPALKGYAAYDASNLYLVLDIAQQGPIYAGEGRGIALYDDGVALRFTFDKEVNLLQLQGDAGGVLWVHEKLKPVSAGALYNSTGCVCCYLPDLVDSLEAVRYAVYEHRLCTLAEMRRVVAENWQGHEKLRSVILRKASKWGNNDPRADALAVEFAAFASEQLFRLPNGRGGFFFPALFGQLVVEIGREFGALPSGRLAGEPMAKNLDAVIGMDRNGVTALMDSVLKVDMQQFPNGTCLDLMLHPTSVRGEEGIGILVSLIRTFIAHGGSGIQFNIFDVAVLRDAQKHPEKYENLQVRVCGWNVRFTDLEPAAQETFIRQAEAIA